MLLLIVLASALLFSRFFSLFLTKCVWAVDGLEVVSLRASSYFHPSIDMAVLRLVLSFSLPLSFSSSIVAHNEN